MNKVTRYYTPRQVSLACFLGGPPAGCWLMARTYYAASEVRKARASLIWGIVGTLALMALSFVLPDRIPRAPMALVIAVSMEQVAKYLQAPIILRCVSAGIAKGSWWMVVGVAALSILVICGIVVGAVYFLPQE